MKEYSRLILSLPRFSKQAIAIITDIGLCVLCTWFSFILRLDEIILLNEFKFYTAIISIIIAIPIFWLFGFYKAIFRHNGFSIIFNVLISIFVYGILFFLVIGVYGIQEVPRSIGVIQPMLLFFAITLSRLTVKFLLNDNYISKKSKYKQNVLVYGAGETGRQLVVALEDSSKFRVFGFLDDNKLIQNKMLLGRIIYSPLAIKKLIQNHNISLVLLALPKMKRRKRNEIIEYLSKHKLNVKTLPSISDIVDGKITLSDIKDFNIEDLLNRDEVKPDNILLNQNINAKSVVVTGAGGSIGSELCRQIAKLNPSKLIMLELNEFALYKIYEELSPLYKNLRIITLLMNCQDRSKLDIIFKKFKVDTVYHTAAYKHVPLVEENICEGVKNNVFSTLSIAKASINNKVSNFVLISSDKAVRPTNVMGASKRLSEICVQAICNHYNSKTSFSIVRFGNVLESSGSVIPKFKQQIKENNYITLTHPDVTRYFMTITEAAQLVIQAGAIGRNAEVFVLDMGKSVKIIDLIHKMVKFSGLSIKNKNNVNGDVEIKITGLRPGEKLYEELLIGDKPIKTYHDKIKKAQDPYIEFNLLKIHLESLTKLIDNNDVVGIRNLLNKLIISYKPNPEIVDHIYNEQKSLQELTLIQNQDNKVINLNIE